MQVVRVSAVALFLGVSGCSSFQGIDTVRPTLTAFTEVADAAQVHADATADPTARMYRTAVLTQALATGSFGQRAPDAEASPQGHIDVGVESGVSEEVAQSPYLQTASEVLCNAQPYRLAGHFEVQRVSAVARNARAFDIEPPDNLIDNAFLLGAQGRAPSLQSPSQTSAPNQAPQTGGSEESGPMPNADPEAGTSTNVNQNGAANAAASPSGSIELQAAYRALVTSCKADVTAASQGNLIEISGQESDLSTALDVVGILDRSLRAQATALLRQLVLIQRLQDLRAYLRENEQEIEGLRRALVALQPQMEERTQLARRMAAYDYLLAFDAFRADVGEITPNPVGGAAVSRGVDLREVDSLDPLLESATAYDHAMSAGASEAYADLAEALAGLQRIKDHPSDAAGGAASLRAQLAFFGSLRSLADATNDPELRAALRQATGRNRAARTETPAETPDETPEGEGQ